MSSGAQPLRSRLRSPLPPPPLPPGYGGHYGNADWDASSGEQAAISLAGLSVADATNPSHTMTTTLTVTNGTITAGGETGATVTLSGTAAAINTALASASNTGNSGFMAATR